MKKFLGIVVLVLLLSGNTYSEILDLKCSQDSERIMGKKDFKTYWLPQKKMYYKFDLTNRKLIEWGIGKHKTEQNSILQYWKNKKNNDELIRGLMSGSNDEKQMIFAFTIIKNPTKKKYSHEVISLRVSKNLFEKFKKLDNKSYSDLEKDVNFDDEYFYEASGLLKGKCKVLN
ncbi:hypothetical protein [Candidatus Pelagibacter ubique]|uniref:hypothetical protein n=1 Tax=Pelagibacter ubique TaxID=198252 RepID=UPI0003D1AA81